MTVIVRAAAEADLPAILAIYNDAVAKTTAIWNDGFADLDNRRQWYEGRRRLNYPVLVATLDDAVIGYASFGDFRAFDGHLRLLKEGGLVQEERDRGWTYYGLAAAPDAPGRAWDLLRREIGQLVHQAPAVARMPEVGFKFGRWLDLVFMQRTL